MADMQNLFHMVRNLEPEELQQLRTYIDQLQAVPPQQPQKRILDMHPGAIWISDDFTDPLPDEFWLGEE